jgi:hypothetical protein
MMTAMMNQIEPNCLDVGGEAEVDDLSWCRDALGVAVVFSDLCSGEHAMATKKTKDRPTKDHTKDDAGTTVTVPVSKRTKTRVDDAKPKKVSALDAAFMVLVETGQPMNCQELIAVMAAKGYWTSPNGKNASGNSLHGGDRVAEFGPRRGR